MLLIDVVCKVIPPDLVELTFIAILPVVVIPLLIVTSPPVVVRVKLPAPLMAPVIEIPRPLPPPPSMVKLLFNVIPPLKVEYSVLLFTPIFKVPLLPDATVIEFEYVTPNEYPNNVALLELPGVESPIVIVPVPAALALPANLHVPDFIVTPLEKVLFPDKESGEVELFWITPVTFVPITAEIVAVPEPAPELVIVPVLLIGLVWIVIPCVFVTLMIILPLPVIPPETVNAPIGDPRPIVKFVYKVISPAKVPPV